MSETRQGSDDATWGCLGAGMILLGVASIYIFEIAGGTDYAVEYMAAGSVIGGVAILALLLLRSRSDQQKVRLPRLSPILAFAALAAIFYVLLF
jgi:Flp pilus assembly protein protease CpaA